LFSYSEGLELDDAIHTAILTLKEGFEGQMTENNIEIGTGASRLHGLTQGLIWVP
jgi:20S proteasome subunit alpha 2